jgi:hypothetical protein
MITTRPVTDALRTWNPTLVKAFLEHKQTRAVRKALIVARNYAAETRAKVDAYEAPIFAKYEFYNDLDTRAGSPRRRLERIGEIYLSEDEAACAKLYAELQAAHRLNGYNVKEDCCPALVAENEVIRLENALLTWGSTFFNFDFTGCRMELRERAIELFMAA